MNRKKGKMLVGEGLDSLCNYIVRCFFFIYSAVLQRCHNRGWTSPSPLYLLSEQLTMEHSAGGDPDRLIVLWQPWPSQLEDRKQQNTACLPDCSPPPLPHASSKLHPPIYLQYTLNNPSSPLFTLMQSLQLKTSSCIITSSMKCE